MHFRMAGLQLGQFVVVRLVAAAISCLALYMLGIVTLDILQGEYRDLELVPQLFVLLLSACYAIYVTGKSPACVDRSLVRRFAVHVALMIELLAGCVFNLFGVVLLMRPLHFRMDRVTPFSDTYPYLEILLDVLSGFLMICLGVNSLLLMKREVERVQDREKIEEHP